MLKIVDEIKYEMIYVDMDGVLSNFRKSVFELFDIRDRERYMSHFDLAIAIASSKSKFWRTIENEKNFWLNLEKFDYADNLMKIIEKYSKRIVIVSNCCEDPKCYMQKKIWLDKNGFGEYEHLIGSANKDVLAGGKNWEEHNHKLLIDDYYKNIKKFRHAGGYGILFPQEYNIDKMIPSLDKVPDDKVAYIDKKLYNGLGPRFVR